jgi:hypothetical protein
LEGLPVDAEGFHVNHSATLTIFLSQALQDWG